MTKENRIIVDGGKVTIMLNSDNPTTERTKNILKMLCYTISGADSANDLDEFGRGIGALTQILLNRVKARDSEL